MRKWWSKAAEMWEERSGKDDPIIHDVYSFFLLAKQSWFERFQFGMKVGGVRRGQGHQSWSGLHRCNDNAEWNNQTKLITDQKPESVRKSFLLSSGRDRVKSTPIARAKVSLCFNFPQSSKIRKRRKINNIDRFHEQLSLRWRVFRSNSETTGKSS